MRFIVSAFQNAASLLLHFCVFSDECVFNQTHGASPVSLRCSVAPHPLPLTPPAHKRQEGRAAAQQHRDADRHRNHQGVSGYVPPWPKASCRVLLRLPSLAPCCLVLPRAALGVIGGVPTPLQCSGELRGGGVTMMMMMI